MLSPVPDPAEPRRPYDPDVRATLCPACDAPFEVPVVGGTIPCPACGASHELPPRELRPVRFDARLPEQQRLARLREQDGAPWLAPPDLQVLLEHGAVPDWRLAEARAAWHSARRSAQQTNSRDAEDRLAFLTLVLLNRKGERGERFRKRAFLESALEAVRTPRYRQDFLCRLSRTACRTGDLRAAERWLELCDSRPDDLAADSDWRISRAMLQGARRDWAGVLRLLGERPRDVPVFDALDNFAAVLRTDALEHLGRLDEAVEQLAAVMKHRPGFLAIENFTTSGPWCAAAFPKAAEQAERNAAETSAETAGGGLAAWVTLGFGALPLVVALVWAGLAALGWTTFESLVDMLPVFGFIGATLLLFGGLELRRAGRARGLRLKGLPREARVLSISQASENESSPGVFDWRIELTVRPPDRAPYDATTRLGLTEAAAAKLTPGTIVHVRVDPQDPSRVLIETHPV